MYKIGSTSDIHLGHPKVSVEHLDTIIRKYLFPVIKTSNLFIFAGDVFHQLLRLDAPNTQLIVILITDILQLAKKSNCIIRVLRGTYTHDRNQNTIFNTVNKNIGADVNIVEQLSLEYIEAIDSRILYIPDNLPYTDSNTCIEEIVSLLSKVGWDTVDIAVMHGYFKHVLPEGIPHEPHCTFSWSQFKNIVKHVVLSGHVHLHSKYKNIYYHGSLDRLAHNEEEAKGFLVLEGTSQSHWNVKFVENKHSTNFITVHPIGETVDELLQATERLIRFKYQDAPITGHLRIIVPNPEYRQILVHHFSVKYAPALVVTGQSVKQTESSQVVQDICLDEFSTIVPTEENLAELSLQWLKSNQITTTLTAEKIHERLFN